jgi:hypothetical protein
MNSRSELPRRHDSYAIVGIRAFRRPLARGHLTATNKNRSTLFVFSVRLHGDE